MNFGNHDNLGHVLGEFGWNKGRTKAVLWLWIFLLLPSLLFSFVIIGLPGLILSCYFIYRSSTRLRTTQPVVSVYEQGLIDKRKGTPKVIRYEEIKNIYVTAVVINGVLNYGLTLELPNRQKVVLNEHLANIDSLRKLLEEQIVRHQLPAAIAMYQQGNPIGFGNLHVAQAGLSMGKKLLPWSEFESAEIQRMSNTVYLTIRQKGNKKEWGLQSRDTFPNLALFLAMVNYIQRTYETNTSSDHSTPSYTKPA
jgi:hypothetical protein